MTGAMTDGGKEIGSRGEMVRNILWAKMPNDPRSSSKSCFPLFHAQSYKTFSIKHDSLKHLQLVFPEVMNPKHLWCLRETYMQLNDLILCKPQVTSDLYSGKKDPWWRGGRAGPEPCCRAAYFIFSPRGLEELLHSGVLVEVTRLLYKQFTWRASSAQRECLMQCSQFLERSNAQDAEVSNFNHAALSLCLRFLPPPLFLPLCWGNWKPRLINLVSCLG